MLDSVSGDFLKEIQTKEFIRGQIMYVSKLRGGVLIKYQKLPSNCQSVIGDPAAIIDEGVIPPKNDKATNKI